MIACSHRPEAYTCLRDELSQAKATLDLKINYFIDHKNKLEQQIMDWIDRANKAEAQLAEREQVICRAREHMVYIARHTNKIDSIDDAWMRLLDVEQLNNYVTEVTIPALSSSSPCVHAVELDRATKEIRAKDTIIEEVCEERDRIKERARDVEGMAKMVAGEKWGESNWEGLSDSGRSHCRVITAHLSGWLTKEEG